MGALWSRAAPENPAARLLRAPGARSLREPDGRSGKPNGRPLPAPERAAGGLTPGKRARERAFGADEETQRFVVRCKGVFWLSKKDVAKLLRKAPALPPYEGLHKIARWDHFFVNFRAADAAAARAALENLAHRGVPFAVAPAEHPAAKRRRTHARLAAAAAAADAAPAKCPSAADATAPWAAVPYPQQAQRKRRLWAAALAKVGNRMRSDGPVYTATPWLRALKPGAPVCALEGEEFCDAGADAGAAAAAAAGRDFYRNKSEFTVGLSVAACPEPGHIHAAAPTVGYALGLVRAGEFRVGAISDHCRTTSVAAREVAAALTDVVRESGQPPYDRLAHAGYWRLVSVRTSARTRQALVCVMVSAGGACAAEPGRTLSDMQCRHAVRDALRDLFGADDRFGLFWQTSDALAPAAAEVPAEHVCGLPALIEELAGLRFQVHPASFFQVNTVMAERLYAVVRDFAAVAKDSVVLDVCCGTGTIGLSLAGAAHSVVGVEVCEPAVADARANAERNGITNAEFVAGPAETVIQQVVQRLDPDRPCVAVLDPPRAGVANSVISAVRGARCVRRVVYVCCEPSNLWKNVMALCRPTSNAFRGDPFRPIRAAGVDMFPHTPKGEMVLLLER